MRMRTKMWLAVLGAGLAGCGDNGNTAGQVTALFDLSQTASGGAAVPDFYALPFPCDLRLTADGHIDLTNLTRPNQVLEDYFATFQAKTVGFGANAPIIMEFTNPIDTATIPTPQGSMNDGASIYLVDVDKAS